LRNAAVYFIWQLKVPLGYAPSCFAEYQAILTILPKPPPECTHPLSRLFFASAAKRARYGLFAVLESVLSYIGLILFMVDKPNHIALVLKHLRKAARREDVPPLAAALEEWLEALSILRGNQGRSQAAPLAASRQRTRCRDRAQPQRNSRILRDS